MSNSSSVLIPFNRSPGSERAENGVLQGDLVIPKEPNGIILFCHGSGSGRHSTRNRSVADALNKDGLATLLVDLLTVEEEQADIRAQKMQCKIPGLLLNKFNVKLLGDRVTAIAEWISSNDDIKNLVLGYFGASTGTAAALIAAAAIVAFNIKNQKKLQLQGEASRAGGEKGGRELEAQNLSKVELGAIVSRSGRPDLAGLQNLANVKVPTLFIVGGKDHDQVMSWNKNALRYLGSEKKKLVVVPNASHLFEEPGTLEEVARLASGWFRCFFQIMRHQQENS
jgi:putative phosphoribosyl transferase